MKLFYSKEIYGGICHLDEEESGHCIRVLRHRCGDEIKITDGEGSIYTCRITNDSPKKTEAAIIGKSSKCSEPPYHLEMAVCPTKNADRYEWFVEKATEIGVGSIVPVIGEHSERKQIKSERLEKIVVSAAKQSLKSRFPRVSETISIKDYLAQKQDDDCLKLIACCFEDEEHPRKGIMEAIKDYFSKACLENESFSDKENAQSSKACLENESCSKLKIAVLIGPEGDFSQEEEQMAVASGWQSIHLGASRLRTETAALTAVEAVYLGAMLFSDNLNLGIYTDLED